jgi:hypothetical protein
MTLAHDPDMTWQESAFGNEAEISTTAGRD